MYNDETKRKLENIIRGSLIEGASGHCTAVRNFLCTSFSTSTTVKRNFESKLLIKKEQESGLRNYSTENQVVNPERIKMLAFGEPFVLKRLKNSSFPKFN